MAKRTTYKIWEAHGKTLLVSIGGNRKTDRVVELTLVPTTIVDNWDTIKNGETNSIKCGSLYVKALQKNDNLEKVCPSECGHLQAKTCYVQHNPRNAAQVVGILNGLSGFMKFNELATYLQAASDDGVTNVRSMVAGDASMVPQWAWMMVERVITSVYPAGQWLGYTHGWKTAPWLKKTHVASVENSLDARAARANSWAVFESGEPTISELPSGATLCPGSKQFEHHKGFKISCSSCPIRCNGETGKHVIVPRHAMGDSGRQRGAANRGVVIRDNKGRIRGKYAA